MDGYIEPDMRVAGPLLARLPPGPVVMLNLLRFAETADYAAHRRSRRTRRCEERTHIDAADRDLHTARFDATAIAAGTTLAPW